MGHTSTKALLLCPPHRADFVSLMTEKRDQNDDGNGHAEQQKYNRTHREPPLI
jgi:hypothetical protein